MDGSGGLGGHVQQLARVGHGRHTRTACLPPPSLALAVLHGVLELVLDAARGPAISPFPPPPKTSSEARELLKMPRVRSLPPPALCLYRRICLARRPRCLVLPRPPPLRPHAPARCRPGARPRRAASRSFFLSSAGLTPCLPRASLVSVSPSVSFLLPPPPRPQPSHAPRALLSADAFTRAIAD